MSRRSDPALHVQLQPAAVGADAHAARRDQRRPIVRTLERSRVESGCYSAQPSLAPLPGTLQPNRCAPEPMCSNCATVTPDRPANVARDGFYRIESEEADASTTLAVPSIMTLHHSTDARLRPTSRGPYQSARSATAGRPLQDEQTPSQASPRFSWSGMHGWVSMAMWPTTLGNPFAKGSDAS